MRLFYHAEQRTQAAVALAQQGDFGFSYVSLTTRTKDGTTFTTTNYPFAATMKHSPKQKLNRYTHAASFEDLLARHEDFIHSQGVGADHLAGHECPDRPQHHRWRHRTHWQRRIPLLLAWLHLPLLAGSQGHDPGVSHERAALRAKPTVTR
jgi:hypothetical protein